MSVLSHPICMMENNPKTSTRLFLLRDQAGESIHRAAAWLHVSHGHLWNCEQKLTHLTPEQDASLRSFYWARIAERMKQLAATLQADGEIHGANPTRRKP
jgi:hypothetical protein